ncbi:hypothetical protein D047_4805A, partial [Vibrio parahaemolyticus VPTS-2010_2]
MEHHLLV